MPHFLVYISIFSKIQVKVIIRDYVLMKPDIIKN